MSRIRTVKPEFFRHEDLQALEAANSGQFVMLVYAGLWTVADKAGRFEWRPKHLKLDILPFLTFDLERTLGLLAEADFIKAYDVDGKRYGFIPALPEHQRFSGTEAKSPPKYPEPGAFLVLESPKEAPRKHSGSSKERTGSSQGNTNLKAETLGQHSGTLERKGKGVKERSSLIFQNPETAPSTADAVPSPAAPEDAGVDPESWPNSWAHETSQRFLTHGVVIPVWACGSHAKPVRDQLPWAEWLRVVDRMATSPDVGYGLPALLRKLPEFRDDPPIRYINGMDEAAVMAACGIKA